MTIMTWFVFSSNMVRINSLNRLRVRLNKHVKSSQSRQRLSWQKLSSRPNLPRNSRRRAILPSRFSRLFGLKSMMNWELADESIQQAMEMLALDGRISVITFHSLEDRLTKQLFKEGFNSGSSKGLPFIPDDLKPKMELVSRKPILPSAEEVRSQ